jgi:UDP-hydrolysing UDP-N-acetyl-D-glucosamine 2-epimerase
LSSQARRKICVVLVDRANYGRLKPLLAAIQAHPALELQVLAAGTMVLHRFQNPVKVVQADGFPVDGRIYMEVEGSVPTTMAKSIGLGIIEFTNEFERLKPDVVLLIGDRYEALAAAIAAAYMNLCLVHVQGGEVSGSIDESARHAISKLAHYHVPSTQRAAEYLVRMGERPETILTVGCPSSDLARTCSRVVDPTVIASQGGGANLDITQPFLLVVFHPTTTEFGSEAGQMEELLRALDQFQMPTLQLWPNIDTGADRMSKIIRMWRTGPAASWLRVLINLNPEDYLNVLASTACAIGNSSSFVRDAGFFGTPVVLVGNRQEGREHGGHVLPVAPREQAIVQAARFQLAHGRYPPSTLYGDGHVAPRVADALARIGLYVQKRLAYVAPEAPDLSARAA